MPALRRQKQTVFCEFKANLANRQPEQTARAHMKPCFKKNLNKTTLTTKTDPIYFSNFMF